MKKTICIAFLIFITTLVSAQNAQNIIGSWKGWYVEGQKSYSISLEVKRFNGIVYEGTVKLNYEDKSAQFSIEGDMQGNRFTMNERDMISHYAPDYIKNPQWCKADYEFTFSNLGDRFQLDGIMKLPDVNIAYVNGVKVYDSPKCTYFEKGEIRLQRKNPAYKGEVHLEERKQEIIYIPKRSTNILEVITGELIRQPLEYRQITIGGINPSKRNVEEKKKAKPIVKNEAKKSEDLNEIKTETKAVEDDTEKTETIVENKKPKKGWLARLKEKVFKQENKEEIVQEKVDSVAIEATVDESEPLKKEYTNQEGREIIERSTIESNEGIAQIQVWDDRSVDGDVISIYHNGNLVEENINLLKEKKEVLITLDRGKNVIVMHAVNLGEIPPNSAAMLINTGDKQYSMVLTSDTKKSESIVIYYYP